MLTGGQLAISFSLLLHPLHRNPRSTRLRQCTLHHSGFAVRSIYNSCVFLLSDSRVSTPWRGKGLINVKLATISSGWKSICKSFVYYRGSSRRISRWALGLQSPSYPANALTKISVQPGQDAREITLQCVFLLPRGVGQRETQSVIMW